MRAALLAFHCITLAVSGSPYSQRAPSAERQLQGGFNTNQLIDVSGVHAYDPPGPTDLRGPCPGMNALANHHYIPHNGIVPMLDAILVSIEVFGMGPDTAAIAGILSLYGGNLLDVPLFRFSIGGEPPEVLGGLLGILFANPTGLSGTHNQFESDTSPMRCDLYECGDNHSAQPLVFADFLELLAERPDPINNLDVVFLHRRRRREHSIANNPYFFYGPMQMLVSCLTNVFISGMMSNHSTTYPGGYLAPEGLISLFGMSVESDGTYKYTRGAEQIPPNWYRRPRGDTYLAGPDLVSLWLTYPDTLVLGGNTNGTNTFAPVDISDLTHGVYSTALLLKGSNAACFAFQLLQLLIPDILNNVEEFVADILAHVAQLVGYEVLALACPKLEAIKVSLLEKYPGYIRSLKHSAS
ncbi:Chloroperoxidase [Mycena vulgaris]|nr:Chloroperoxidase [Mycena vulgaris]